MGGVGGTKASEMWTRDSSSAEGGFWMLIGGGVWENPREGQAPAQDRAATPVSGVDAHPAQGTGFHPCLVPSQLPAPEVGSGWDLSLCLHGQARCTSRGPPDTGH